MLCVFKMDSLLIPCYNVVDQDFMISSGRLNMSSSCCLQIT